MDQKKALIGVVDDDQYVRKALTRLIKSLGLDVVSFASGENFLDSHEENTADCLVLDVHLGGMSGFELQEKLALAGTTIPIIFITAHDVASTHDHAMNSGAVAYLRKPFDDEALITAIDKAIGQTYPNWSRAT